MNIVISNHTNVAVPVMSSDEGGWCESAEPGVPLTVSKPDTDALIIGDKPDVTDAIVSTLQRGLKVIKDLIEMHTKSKEGDIPTLNFTIGNNGPNFIRIVLGDGVTAYDVAPGVNYSAHAPGYIEVLELGLAPEQGGTPD